MDFIYKMVILVRTDLKKMEKGKTAVQVAHAAVSVVDVVRMIKPELYKSWMKEGQKKVVLKVSSLGDLLYYENLARKQGVISVLISDAGLTQLPPGTTTVLGLGPITEKQAKELELDQLKLY